MHITWRTSSEYNSFLGEYVSNLYYALLDGATGNALIAPTFVEMFPGNVTSERVSPDIARGAGDTVSLAYLNGISADEVFEVRIDPSQDDLDGSPADVAVIATPPTKLATRKGRPAIDSGQGGALCLATAVDGDELQLELLDPDRIALMPAQQLKSMGPVEFGLTPDVVARGLTCHTLWSERTEGAQGVFYQAINPDSDGDGLSNLEEWSLQTDPGNEDTDGGGRTDGEEVLIDGTDPNDPADDQLP